MVVDLLVRFVKHVLSSAAQTSFAPLAVCQLFTHLSPTPLHKGGGSGRSKGLLVVSLSSGGTGAARLAAQVEGVARRRSSECDPRHPLLTTSRIRPSPLGTTGS